MDGVSIEGGYAKASKNLVRGTAKSVALPQRNAALPKADCLLLADTVEKLLYGP